MNWQILILLHALFSALATLQFRAVARKKSARRSGWIFNAIAFSALFISGLIVLPLIGDVSAKGFIENWPIIILSAILFNFVQFFMYKSLTHLDSATASVLGTSSAL